MPTDAVQAGPSREEQWAQVNRILQSPGFSTAEILRSLLSHLAQVAIEEPGRQLKEHEIGVTALGRGADFDPRVDSAVRVHSARLRTRLAEYYQREGAGDPVELILPKGTYVPTFRYRTVAPQESPAPAPAAPTEDGRSAGALRPWLLQAVAALGLIAATSAFWLWRDAPASPSPSVRRFWSAFDSRPQETMVVFSNPRFVGSASTGLRYAAPGESHAPQQINDRYTGIGEAMALHELTRLFDRLQFPLRAKRSALVAWDEARSRNLIFIGGPSVNDSQAELPRLQEFDFKTVDDPPSAGQGGVINLHPAPDEQRYYFNSGPPYVADYAVIGLVPALTPGRRALILAGRTTFGTQGAAEFLMDEPSVASLLRRLNAPGDLPFFEALLRVQISGGVPVRPELVLLKFRK